MGLRVSTPNLVGHRRAHPAAGPSSSRGFSPSLSHATRAVPILVHAATVTRNAPVCPKCRHLVLFFSVSGAGFWGLVPWGADGRLLPLSSRGLSARVCPRVLLSEGHHPMTSFDLSRLFKGPGPF